MTVAHTPYGDICVQSEGGYPVTGKTTLRWLVTTLVTGAALVAATSAATAETSRVGSGPDVAVAQASSQPGRFTEMVTRPPAQLAQLPANPVGTARSATSAVPNSTDGEVGILWQGGFDRDHWWFKISKAEVISIGVGVVCRAIVGGASWFVCPPISAAVNWALSQWPNAGGYWAEFYTDGHVRVGTW
jgi:hypothetical protein